MKSRNQLTVWNDEHQLRSERDLANEVEDVWVIELSHDGALKEKIASLLEAPRVLLEHLDGDQVV